MFRLINADIGGEVVEVQVKYQYVKGIRATNPRLDPDEPANVLLERVYLEGKDITRELPQTDWELIETKLYELHEDE